MGVSETGFETVVWTKLALNRDLWRALLLSVLYHRPLERKSDRKLHKCINQCNRKFWEELIASFPLIRHGPHIERRVQQLFYCCLCICCHSNFIPSRWSATTGGIHTETHRLMGHIYEVRRWDGLKCHDIHTNFTKIGSEIQKLMGGGIHTHTQTAW
jgi:hypothetical protein